MQTCSKSSIRTYRRERVDSKRPRQCRRIFYRKLNRLWYLTAVFVFLSACGFGFQVYDLASSYFSYTTRTSVDIAMPLRLVTPDVSVCIKYRDIYRGALNVSNVTIADIFDGTPDPLSLLSLCIHRYVNSYEAKIVNGTAACNELFKIGKFYFAQYVCYRFEKVIADTKDREGYQRFAFQNIANSLIYQGMFYGLFIDKSVIEGADLFKVAVHAHASWPNEAIAAAPNFNRFSDDVARYNLVRAFYSTIEIIRMPPPYDTQCMVYPYGWKGCENICVREGTIEIFNKVPFTTIESEAMDIGHIGNAMIAQKNNTLALDALEEKCQKVCHRAECNSLFFTTSILKEERSSYDLFAVLVQAPITPRVKVTRTPSSTMTDFLVYITSCVGTWFGISAMSLNPFPHIFRKEKGDCRSCDDCLQAMNRMFDEIRSMKVRLQAKN